MNAPTAPPRRDAFRGLQAAICVAAAALLAGLSIDIPWTRWPEILFFTALAVLAFRLRVRYAGNFVGVEAAGGPFRQSGHLLDTEPPAGRVYLPTASYAEMLCAVDQRKSSCTVFWPIPRVYSGLVRIDRYETAPWGLAEPTDPAFRQRVFRLIDIAFAQRRKTSRNAFAEWAGSGSESASRLLAASIDPARRGETLSIDDFVRLLRRSEADGTADSGQDAEVGHVPAT